MGIFLRNHSVKTVRFGRLAPGGDEPGLAWGGGERRERRRKKYVGVGGIGELRELIACWRDAPFEIILNQEPLSQLQGQINYFFPIFASPRIPHFTNKLNHESLDLPLAASNKLPIVVRIRTWRRRGWRRRESSFTCRAQSVSEATVRFGR